MEFAAEASDERSIAGLLASWPWFYHSLAAKGNGLFE
jgi:hypothetical protein